jgi:Pyruvate/2-oxoacid:ferredoxin oxidoreductase delta subunit
VDENGKVRDGVFAGGDAIDLSIATTAIGQGRIAALGVHAELTGTEVVKDFRPDIPKERIKMDLEDVYPSKAKAQASHRPVDGWISKPDDEITQVISEEQFLEEMTRCFSCGQCFACERCWMFCTPSCFAKADNFLHGEPFYPVELEKCDGCKKCADECPCGFIDMV